MERDAVVLPAQPDGLGSVVTHEAGDRHDEVGQERGGVDGIPDGLLDFRPAGVAVPATKRVTATTARRAICTTGATAESDGGGGTLFDAQGHDKHTFLTDSHL